ncbi:hypothetical protein KCP78_03545 [Salmonella enterica subsp. enterica]|nr:hypothetical protein KCP78_03545 [Salmonella enterica subsp. enterica]
MSAVAATIRLGRRSNCRDGDYGRDSAAGVASRKSADLRRAFRLPVHMSQPTQLYAARALAKPMWIIAMRVKSLPATVGGVRRLPIPCRAAYRPVALRPIPP